MGGITDPTVELEAQRNQVRIQIEIHKDTPRVHELRRRFQDLTRQIDASWLEAA